MLEGHHSDLPRTYLIKALDQFMLPNGLVKLEEKLSRLSLSVEQANHVIDSELSTPLGLWNPERINE